MTTTRASRPPRPRGSRARPPSRRGPAPGRNRTSRAPILVVGGLIAAVAVALAVALVAGGSDDPSGSGEAAEPAPVAVEGRALPPLPDGGDDPAIGRRLPTFSGTDLDGRPLAIAADGRPTIVLFLAHWCPHCRAEVPVVQDWVDAGGLPAGVDLVSVATANDPRRPNHPAADWLAREGWTAPVLLDGPDDEAATAAGLTAFPYFVAVDGDGTVVARAAGELTPAQLDALAGELAGADAGSAR